MKNVIIRIWESYIKPKDVSILMLYILGIFIALVGLIKMLLDN